MRKTKILIGIICSCLIICIVIILSCDAIVCSYAKSRAYNDVSNIHETEVGLLLGTTPQTRIGGRKNYFFTFRIDAAEALYKAGKVNYILISGDNHSLDGIDETQCMRDSLVARGIPANIIFLDGKGYRTYNSIVRASNVFGVRSFTIISQRFHTERALYLAGHLGLNVEDVQGFNAKEPKSASAHITYAREYLARVKMFLDIVLSDPSKIKDDEVAPLSDQIHD